MKILICKKNVSSFESGIREYLNINFDNYLSVSGKGSPVCTCGHGTILRLEEISSLRSRK